MTLLNTITNLAGTWISTLALWLVDNVSFKDCEGVTDLSLDCDTMLELKVDSAIVSFETEGGSYPTKDIPSQFLVSQISGLLLHSSFPLIV